MSQVQNQPVYVYILVREDLSPSQIAVQSCHAAIEATRRFTPGQDEVHPHLVLIGVKNENDLLKAYERLQYHGISITKFEEPDKNNEVTAISTAPIPQDSAQRRLLRNYKLLNLNSVEIPPEIEKEEPKELPECSYCEGRGEIDDPKPCGRCHVRGCRSITCPKCKGNRVEGGVT